MALPELQFAAPPEGRVDVLFVAGEHSGDQHAAQIAAQIHAVHPDFRLSAMGGPALERAGVHLLHDLTQSSVVGFVEVLKHYGAFKRLFEALLDWVEAHQPRVVVLVDYPGFNLRFADALKKRGLSRKGGGNVVVYQYVSPQIWAWKAGRRFKMAQVLDELGVIFPFEVDCYKDTDLPVRFVGHPFARDGYENPLKYDPDGPVLLLPGSRKQAVGRIFPTMVNAIKAYRENGGERPCVCLYPEDEIREMLETELLQQGVDDSIISIRSVEQGANASAVLTSSGTMSLNCALAGIPGAIVYKAHPLTVWMGRRLIRIDWLGIANLVLDRELYPEFIQKDARAGVLSERLQACVSNPEMRESFENGARDLAVELTAESATTVVQRLENLLAD